MTQGIQHDLGRLTLLGLMLVTLLTGCNTSGSGTTTPVVVNSLLDDVAPGQGSVTLRSAIASAEPGQAITFDPELDGKTIDLTLVGEEHSVLTGEVMGFDTANNISFLVGYFDRDYGRSALFARKDLVIDASNLSEGVRVHWNGVDDARVLAVDGNLTLINVTVSGGRSVFDTAADVGQHPDDNQSSTLARGGGIAVWGTATLRNCTIYNNRAEGDPQDSSRDGGAYGGGVYADTVVMENCVVSGNTVSGAGAAGGGVFSVGGRDTGAGVSSISQSAITENRIAGIFAYGGGIYSDGGGIGLATRLHVNNSTIARNLVEPPQLPPFLFSLLDLGYWRGGGLYMSNGYMQVMASTVVENQVYGKPRFTEIDKPNMAGGIAATIGNAHAVEDMLIGQSIVVGNTVHEINGPGMGGYAIGRVYPQDIFTGSVFEFRSLGYNRLGVIDFSQILVPIGEPNWASLSRRHYPQTNDIDLVAADEVLGAATLSSVIPSAGVKSESFAVLHYNPAGSAVNQLPTDDYGLVEVLGELSGPKDEGQNPQLLALVLQRLEAHYGQSNFASDFRNYFESYLADTDPDTAGAQQYRNCHNVIISTLEQAFWCGPSQTWPQFAYNHAYIEFWHHLDRALAGKIASLGVDQFSALGPAGINDSVWEALFGLGDSHHGGTTLRLGQRSISVGVAVADQRGNPRPVGLFVDIGAVEAGNQP